MKIAGRKNDGAWFRTNRFLRKISAAQRTRLQALLEGMDEISQAFEAIRTLSMASGDGGDNWFPTVAAWAEKLTHGIPRQLWYGVLSFDTYKDNGEGTTPRYTKVTQPHVTPFSNALRRVMKHFMFVQAELKDLQNVLGADAGNPGGVADADIDT